MRPVRQILMHLFGRVLSERGQPAPTLDDITIERASARFLPRVVAHFSNGQRSSVSVRPADLYPFCERHSSWDLETLRIALLREGRAIYRQMLENHFGGGARTRTGGYWQHDATNGSRISREQPAPHPVELVAAYRPPANASAPRHQS